MSINCKIIECNKRPGQESIRMTFPERTGEVLTLVVEPDELSQFVEGAIYRLGFELVSAPAQQSETVEENGADIADAIS